MTYFQRLVIVEMRALVALTVAAILFAILLSVIPEIQPKSFGDFLIVTGLRFSSAFIYSLLPVMLFGAPIYALLSQTRRATWTSTMVAGSAPGAFIAAVGLDPDADTVYLPLGLIITLFGLVVALITHWLSKDDLYRGNAI